MREEYTIKAHSATVNQTIREFNLGMGNPVITNKQYAEQVAQAFAQRLNEQQYLKATDWVAKVQWEQAGISTIPGYQFHTGTV